MFKIAHRVYGAPGFQPVLIMEARSISGGAMEISEHLMTRREIRDFFERLGGSFSKECRAAIRALEAAIRASVLR